MSQKKNSDASGSSTMPADMKGVSQETMSNAERKYRKSEKYKREQKRKLTQKIVLISVAAVLLITAVSVGVYAAIQSTYGHVMTFDGKKISTEDFKLFYYLYGSKEDALAALTDDLVVFKEADARGLSLTAEERDNTRNEIANFKDYLTMVGIQVPKVTEERFIDVLGVSLLYNRFSELIDAELEIDEDEFKTAFEDYLETGKKEYTKTQMKYIMSTSDYDASFAREMLLSGMEVDDAIIEYSTAYTEENGIELIELSTMGFDDETASEIMALEVGGVTEVMDFGEAFVFFIIDEITVPEESEIEETFRTTYRNGIVSETFRTQLSEWTSQCKIVVNQKAYDRVK